MEKKTKHRILGIFVIIALVVISLPFFETKKVDTTQVASIKSPPFPAQTDDEETASVTPVTVDEGDTILPVIKSQSDMSNTDTTVESENTKPQNPEDVVAALHPSLIDHKEEQNTKHIDNQPITETTVPSTSNTDSAEIAKPAPVAATTPSDTITETPAILNSTNDEPKVDSEDEDVDNKTIATPKMVNAKNEKVKLVKVQQTKQLTIQKQEPVLLGKIYPYVPDHALKSRLTANRHTATHNKQVATSQDGLLELKNASWVIEIGNYKNKKTALTLVNQLRASGYRAFIQQVSSSFGSNVQVFVGPELKKKSAYALAEQLETEMHIRGIVISYKPFDL